MDEELSEMVSKNMEQTGLMSSVKAQIRAHIFQLLQPQQGESQEETKLSPHNQSIATFLEHGDSQIVIDLVTDFLNCLNLRYTQSVFKTELGRQADTFEDSQRTELSTILQLPAPSRPKLPLLLQLVEAHRLGDATAESTAHESLELEIKSD